MRDGELDFIILKYRLAKKGHFKNLSTTEKAGRGHGHEQAGCLGPVWLARIPAAERVLRDEEASNSAA